MQAPRYALFVFLGLFTLTTIAYGQESDPEKKKSQSGYDDIVEFGGPESVSANLKANDAERESNYQFDTLQRNLGPYFDWKRHVKDDYGVAMGTSFYVLYQKATESLPGQDDDAFGHIFRYQGSWTLFKKDNGNLGQIAWRLESRSQLGGFQAPGSLAGSMGVRTHPPGFANNQKFELDNPNLSWVQHFANGRAGFAVGRLAFIAYLDAFPFQTLSRGFMNRALVLPATLPTTGIGALGAVVKGFITDNIWIGGQMHDANAANGEFDFDTVQEGEWLKAVEVGYTPSIAQRSTHRMQFTYWEKDARMLAGTPKGSGWSLSGAWPLSEKLYPFVRVGHSDGGGGVAAEESISAGMQYTFAHDEVFSVGAGWAKPSQITYGAGLKNETVIESSYKFQLSKNFSLTPDVQVIFNPANNPAKSSAWVFGLRVIFTL
jgi:porin